MTMTSTTLISTPPIVCQPDQVETLPQIPAVFLIWPRAVDGLQGRPYLARTDVLRRRLVRLLAPREGTGRMLNLRSVAERVEYWPAASKLEASILLYELAKAHFPDVYRKIGKIHPAPFLKLTLANPFPRTSITTRLSSGRALYYGPFRSRAAAEEFSAQSLDLFQIRRCQDNLEPSRDHPGCIYGEMNLCSRPCQQVVSPEEYASEVERVASFLQTNGASMLDAVAASRERASAEMEFEDAARHHKRLERVEQVLKLRSELSTEVSHLNGVAITKAPLELAAPCDFASRDENIGALDSAELAHQSIAFDLWFFAQGRWLPPVRFSPSPSAVDGQTALPASMDARLREIVARLPVPEGDREEHIALLVRWYYASWRDGEWLSFDSFDRVPYRKLVNAISRVGKEQKPQA